MAQNWRDRRNEARKGSAFIDGLAPQAEWDRSVREEFRRYWEQLHPDPLARPSDESAQFIETRRAFVAGVYVMLCKMRSVAEPTVSEDRATEHFESLVTECNEFYSMLKRISEDQV